MIDRSHALPVTRQARELGISRGSVYYLPRPTSVADLAIMRRLDELHMDFPFAGSRMLRDLLAAEGVKVGRLHVSTLMRSNYPPPALTSQAETAPRMVWKGLAPDNRAVSTVVRRSASASAAHLAR